MSKCHKIKPLHSFVHKAFYSYQEHNLSHRNKALASFSMSKLWIWNYFEINFTIILIVAMAHDTLVHTYNMLNFLVSKILKGQNLQLVVTNDIESKRAIVIYRFTLFNIVIKNMKILILYLYFKLKLHQALKLIFNVFWVMINP